MADFAPVGMQMSFANSSNVSQVHQNLNNAIALQTDIEADRQKKDDDEEENLAVDPKRGRLLDFSI